MSDYTDYIVKWSIRHDIDLAELLEKKRLNIAQIPYEFIKDMDLEKDYKEYLKMRIELEGEDEQ